MKFGIFGGGKIGGKASPLGDSYAYQDFIQYVIDAEDLGFESAFMVEHHFTGTGQLSASLSLLTYLAARTSRIRLGSAVIVLPWHNPVLLAEQVATLDVLSGGRYEMGVGRGYRKEEFDAFCIPTSEAQERYVECFQLLMKSLTSKERFSHHSKYWNFENIIVEPAPMQQPHPPVWMAAGTTQGIEYVASQGHGVLFDQIASIGEIVERTRIYLDAQEKHGFPRDALRCGVTRALHILKSESEREKAYERRRETLKKIGALARRPGANTPASFADVDIANDDAALIGSPEEIAERLQQLADGGVEYVMLTSATANRETLETFMNKIVPQVKLRVPAPRTAVA
jgi:alkanesulfonate monooxygenase SsuD/methylene tetrahydromethanopterin reductase-like flavin-dependent oxidoreductase (luciferase family)